MLVSADRFRTVRVLVRRSSYVRDLTIEAILKRAVYAPKSDLDQEPCIKLSTSMLRAKKPEGRDMKECNVPLSRLILIPYVYE